MKQVPRMFEMMYTQQPLMYEILLLLHADTVEEMLPRKIYLSRYGLRYAQPGEICVSWKHAYPSVERVEQVTG